MWLIRFIQETYSAEIKDFLSLDTKKLYAKLIGSTVKWDHSCGFSFKELLLETCGASVKFVIGDTIDLNMNLP